MIPVAGPLLSEVVGVMLPQRRLDRLESYLQQLGETLGDVVERLDAASRDDAFLDLLGESLFQAAGASTEKRRKYLANVVKSGLTDADIALRDKRHMLSLLGELNDLEVLILMSFQGLHEFQRHEFLDKHPEVERPMVFEVSPPELHDRAAMHDAYVRHLVNLGLLENQHYGVAEGEAPRLDRSTGALAVSHRSITRLGRMLLRTIRANEA
jgi:hypothetical protein